VLPPLGMLRTRSADGDGMKVVRRNASWELYDWLLARAVSSVPVRRVLLGLQWSVAESEALGLCFSPVDAPRTLSWPGTLASKPATELCAWLRSFDSAESCVGLASLNSLVNVADNTCASRAQPLDVQAPPHLRVFAHFAAELAGAKVVVVGRYPGLDQYFAHVEYTCIERRPFPNTMPDVACEYVLPDADFVFVTASAIANKTLPRLLELSQRARVVLMGPSLPWLAEWADFGVDYLAGVVVRDAEAVWQIAAEGGGTRLFDKAVEYRLLRVS